MSGQLSSYLYRGFKWLVPLVVLAVLLYQFRFAPVHVEIITATRGELTVEVMGTGTLEARVASTISPKISGRINRVLVDQGEQVNSGQQLVQLDDDELKRQVEIAAANVETGKATIVRLQSDKARSLAVYDQALKNHTRVKQLSDRNATTEDELDRAAESLGVATADVARAEAAITEGERALVAAQKSLEYQQSRLADSVIMAPFDGLIVARRRESGDVAVPGSAVLTLISTQVLWISAWVDETAMSQISVGQPARVLFRSDPARSYPGTVARLGRQTDRETREFIVDVQVQELPQNWAVGQRAEVYIQTASQTDTLTIPATVVARHQDQEGVWIAKNGSADFQPLTIGLRGRESVEVLSGLESDDQIIVPSSTSATLATGMKVQAR